MRTLAQVDTTVPVRCAGAALFVLQIASFVALPLQNALSQDVVGCGSLSNAYGPFDYRDPSFRAEQLRLVESAHFSRAVESLAKGDTGSIIGDLDYTLRAFPNHHRALQSVGRYELQGNKRWTNPSVRSADCYFKRAIAFKGDDEVVKMLYANYLSKRGEVAAAQDQYEIALRLSPNDPEINYNAGLFYLEQGQIAKAKQHAAIAYAGGYPLPGLKNKIRAAEKDKSK